MNEQQKKEMIDTIREVIVQYDAGLLYVDEAINLIFEPVLIAVTKT